MENKNDDNKDSMMNKENQESINKKITRKLEEEDHIKYTIICSSRCQTSNSQKNI